MEARFNPAKPHETLEPLINDFFKEARLSERVAPRVRARNSPFILPPISLVGERVQKTEQFCWSVGLKGSPLHVASPTETCGYQALGLLRRNWTHFQTLGHSPEETRDPLSFRPAGSFRCWSVPLARSVCVDRTGLEAPGPRQVSWNRSKGANTDRVKNASDFAGRRRAEDVVLCGRGRRVSGARRRGRRRSAGGCGVCSSGIDSLRTDGEVCCNSGGDRVGPLG